MANKRNRAPYDDGGATMKDGRYILGKTMVAMRFIWRDRARLQRWLWILGAV
ncbi:hypothetical protein K523DRAFT_357146 [Schizophyllum commune Tattone D]|nr:hypothetical protein K523DRAFT_357146 [Schizophyllum commune Tattone D]